MRSACDLAARIQKSACKLCDPESLITGAPRDEIVTTRG
jgi:hypothetical protein